MSREGQTRVEIKPGVFIWMDADAKRAWEARQPSRPSGIESTEQPAPETATLATPGRKRG